MIKSHSRYIAEAIWQILGLYVEICLFNGLHSPLQPTVTVNSDTKLFTVLKYQIGSTDCAELVDGLVTTLIPC